MDERLGELGFIDWIRRNTSAGRRVEIGPGDDAGAVSWPAGASCLVATDMLLEGSCFLLEESPIQKEGFLPASPRRVGRKAMAVNLSDMAAMAAVPVGAVVSVGLPRRSGCRHLAEELYLGLREVGDAFDTPIIGGDTNTWDGPLTISVTIFGEPGPGGIVRRNGCREGDWLLVTGALGGSIRGKHLDFTPRVREALFLAGNFSLHGMIDISDGLASDLHKLCQESGCGATLWEDSIPITPEAQAMGDAVSPLDHALGDGEDYELLFSLPEKEARKLLQSQPIPGLTLHGIGQCIAGGIWLEKEGRRLPLPPRGWVHAME